VRLRRIVAGGGVDGGYGHRVRYEELEHPRVASVDPVERADQALRGDVESVLMKGLIEEWQPHTAHDGWTRRLFGTLRRWVSVGQRR
jgi:hypothetical protein